MAERVYDKGSPPEHSKEWYHGEMSRVEAEHVLAASGCDCFLVRVSEGALILSLIHHGQLHHINIKYGRGWYELENGNAQYTLSELEELVSYYSINQIEELQIKLGAACTQPKTEAMTARDLYESILGDDTSQNYATAEPEDLIKHSWYHGNITREQAEAALRESPDNGFLVRASNKNLVLSKRLGGWISHDAIHCSPKGYRLDGKDKHYESVSELITHYQHHPIEGSQMLGTAIATVPSVQELEEELTYAAILFRKEDTNLNIKWEKACDLPVAISAPQVVTIGNSVYVGGGMRKSGERCTIFELDKAQEKWIDLPACPTYNHALTKLNGELIAIGGEDKAISKAVYTFRRGVWIPELPSMPTPRYYLAASSYNNNMLIAAGGITQWTATGSSKRTDTVEIYSTEHHTWYTVDPLPFPISAFAICTINETCYILGGTRCKDDLSTILQSQMPVCLQKTRKRSQKRVLLWKTLNSMHPLSFSTPVELDGRLVALGGSSHALHRCGTKYVSVYDSASDTWMECKGARLPIPLYKAGVVKLDSDQVMIVGGQPKMQQFSAAVYIGKLLYESHCQK